MISNVESLNPTEDNFAEDAVEANEEEGEADGQEVVIDTRD